MMRNLLFSLLLGLIFTHSYSQASVTIKRPKLVVGIVIDQMRWDYLYRYYDRFAENGGFKTLLQQGFACENTDITYVPSVTACGHASIFTGSIPSINGIVGNDWWDYEKNQYTYCTDDATQKTVGSNSDQGKMSPAQLLVTTIGDELKLASNFRSKVIGIALKDRSAILPAGHSANAAYWFDQTTGDWISSSYYMNELPAWAKQLNGSKLPDKYYAQDWSTLFPIDTYIQSVSSMRTFPKITKQYAGQRYDIIVTTPFGNNLTIDMAKAAIDGEQLGTDLFTDLLTLSFSTPDYIGHAYGPNSIEEEDCFLKLDVLLGEFFRHLDEKIGKNDYLLFLTADHGAAHVPAFLKNHKIPAGNFDSEKMSQTLNTVLQPKFKTGNIVKAIINEQVYIDRVEIKSKKIDREVLYDNMIDILKQDTAIADAIRLDELNDATISDKVKSKIRNGYHSMRSGDIQIILKPQFIDGFLNGGTTHGVWNPYDSHIPLLWYGWNIPAGKTHAPTAITDIAPTLAAILNLQTPSGTVGQVIEGIIKE